MTWKEFKSKVEALGVRDEDELWFIDWASLYEPKRFAAPLDTAALGVAIIDG